MRIVTWNLNGRAHEPQWEALDKLDPKPNIFLFQECRSLGERWPSQSVVHSLAVRDDGKSNPWGSAIVVPGHTIEAVPLQAHHGWVVAARVIDGPLLASHVRPLCVISLHTPTGRLAYPKYLSAILDSLQPLKAMADLIIGGDFNLLTLVRSPPVGSIQPKAAERLVLKRIEEDLELQNCWVTANRGDPNAVPPQTLYWSKNKTKPFHCDGIYVPSSWPGEIRSEVLGNEWAERSDHSPVIADVVVEAPIRDVAQATSGS